MNSKHPNNDVEFRVNVAALGIILVAAAGLIAMHFVIPEWTNRPARPFTGWLCRWSSSLSSSA